MRRLHGAGRWQAGAVLLLSDRGSGRKADHDHRRARHDREATSAASRLHRGASGAMRLLHQRHGDDGGGAARPQPAAERQRDASGAGEQSLPLRDACANSSRRGAGGTGDGAMSGLVLSRRGFIQSAGALTLAFSLTPAAFAAEPAKLPGSLANNRMLDAWVRINADGTVTICT